MADLASQLLDRLVCPLKLLVDEGQFDARVLKRCSGLVSLGCKSLHLSIGQSNSLEIWGYMQRRIHTETDLFFQVKTSSAGRP
jgi:hypothetical protein